GFEDPPPPRQLRIEMLEEALVESIRLEVTVALQPALVARDAIDAVVSQALEHLRGDVGALLRLPRRHLVQRVELRREQTHQIELRLYSRAVQALSPPAGG